MPSAQVTPHYGWPSKTKTLWKKGHRVEEKLPDAPPFIAEPLDSQALAPVKSVGGNPVVLDARYAVWSSDTTEAEKDEGDEPTLEMARGSDAKSELQVMATVRVRNPGRSKLVVFVRRELITFEVMTPRGSVSCVAEPDKRNPDRRAFVTLNPHGSITLPSRLVELCPRGTFTVAGLYLVQARFDASADGSDLGLSAFTGSLHTSRPVPVRVRRSLQIIPNHTVGPSGGPGGPPMMTGVMPQQMMPQMPQMPQQPMQQPAPPPPPPQEPPGQ